MSNAGVGADLNSNSLAPVSMYLTSVGEKSFP